MEVGWSFANEGSTPTKPLSQGLGSIWKPRSAT